MKQSFCNAVCADVSTVSQLLICPGPLALHSTDHELIPASNTSLAAVHGSAIENNVRYYPT
jgi:hypothetical protein